MDEETKIRKLKRKTETNEKEFREKIRRPHSQLSNQDPKNRTKLKSSCNSQDTLDSQIEDKGKTKCVEALDYCKKQRYENMGKQQDVYSSNPLEGSSKQALKGFSKQPNLHERPPEETYAFSCVYGINSDPQEIIVSGGAPRGYVLDITEEQASTSMYSKHGTGEHEWSAEEESELSASLDDCSLKAETRKNAKIFQESFYNGKALMEQENGNEFHNISTTPTMKYISEDMHSPSTNYNLPIPRSAFPETGAYQIEDTYTDAKRHKTQYPGDKPNPMDDGVVTFCGNCENVFGEFNMMLPSLVRLQIKNNDYFKRIEYFVCFVCQAHKKKRFQILMHAVDHILRNEIKCMKCQNENNSEKDIYCLEGGLTTEKDRRKLFELDPKTEAIVANLTVRCPHCNTIIGQASELVTRMFERSLKQEAKIVILSCIICGGSITKRDIMRKHILHHFCNKQLFCKECCEKLHKGIIKIEGDTNVGGFMNKPVVYSGIGTTTLPSINCGRCGMYLCESSILITPSKDIQMSVAFPESLTTIHNCFLCSASGTKSEIEKHMLSHVKNVFCELCQFKYKLDTSLRRIAHNLYMSPFPAHFQVPVICGKCAEPFSNANYALANLLQKYSLKKKEGKVIYLDHCLHCGKGYISNHIRARDHALNHITQKELLCQKCTTQIE